jgi:hypothetical protein
MGELVHALTDADGGGQVVHGVDALQRFVDGNWISHVTANELYL